MEDINAIGVEDLNVECVAQIMKHLPFIGKARAACTLTAPFRDVMWRWVSKNILPFEELVDENPMEDVVMFLEIFGEAVRRVRICFEPCNETCCCYLIREYCPFVEQVYLIGDHPFFFASGQEHMRRIKQAYIIYMRYEKMVSETSSDSFAALTNLEELTLTIQKTESSDWILPMLKNNANLKVFKFHGMDVAPFVALDYVPTTVLPSNSSEISKEPGLRHLYVKSLHKEYLQYMCRQNCHFSWVVTDIFDYLAPMVETLVLGGEHFRYLHYVWNNFKALKRLVVFDLKEELMNTLRDTVKNLPQLEYLDLNCTYWTIKRYEEIVQVRKQIDAKVTLVGYAKKLWSDFRAYYPYCRHHEWVTITHEKDGLKDYFENLIAKLP